MRFIKVLEKVKFENLEVLNLNSNQIIDYKGICKHKFENIKELDLYNYKINKKYYFSLIDNLRYLSI